MSLRNGVIKAGTVVYKKVRVYIFCKQTERYNDTTGYYESARGDINNPNHYRHSRNNAIVKLITLEDGLIPFKHRRGTKTNNSWDEGHRKCRVPKAYVASIEQLEPMAGTVKFLSAVRGTILDYKVGEVVVPDMWDNDPKKVCTHGIHVFLTREEAEAYPL